jgi:hypothetical protein
LAYAQVRVDAIGIAFINVVAIVCVDAIATAAATFFLWILPTIDVDLKTVYASVLPICAACESQGAKIGVRRYVPNGKELLKR